MGWETAVLALYPLSYGPCGPAGFEPASSSVTGITVTLRPARPKSSWWRGPAGVGTEDGDCLSYWGFDAPAELESATSIGPKAFGALTR